jgi:hypothetical protein
MNLKWTMAWSGLLWLCAFTVAADPVWILWQRTTRTVQGSGESGVPAPEWQARDTDQPEPTKAACEARLEAMVQAEKELAQPNCAVTTDGVTCTVETPAEAAVSVTEYKCLPDTRTP